MRKRLLAGARLLVGTAVALLALSACRSAPTAAAYVGDSVITEQRITDLTDGWNDKAPADRKVTRDLVVAYALGERLCDRASKEKGFSYEQPTVPAESPEFLTLAVRFESCRDAIPVGRASEAELREYYGLLVAEGQLSPDVKFEDVRTQMEADQNLQRQLSWQRALNEQAKAADVVVNPRYSDPFGADAVGTVVDRPVPQQQQPQQP